MATRKTIKGHIMMYKTLYRKLKIPTKTGG